MDESIVAPVIYKNEKHKTTNQGVILEEEITKELRRFFHEFHTFVWKKDYGNLNRDYKEGHFIENYYRLDAYFDNNTLNVLEINASFVDGWGTAFNLARASGIKVSFDKCHFPKKFGSTSSDYLPELELFVDELKKSGLKHFEDCKVFESWKTEWLKDNQTYDWGKDAYSKDWYVYGRGEREDGLSKPKLPRVLPWVQKSHSGEYHTMDSKMHLALFSKEWNGNFVKIPKHYIAPETSWEDIPKKVVLKFCEKDSDECKRVRQSVLFDKPEGKSKFLRKCYENKMLIVQDFVRPSSQKIEGSIYEKEDCQIIIFIICNEPITGYVQYSNKYIINDNSTHGPLLIKN